jgi:hypothetical protein
MTKRFPDRPVSLTLRRSDIDTIVGQLPRCNRAFSTAAGKPKAAIPVLALARYVAAYGDQIVYRCGHHYHLTTVRDSIVRTVRPDAVESLVLDTDRLARSRGVRMVVYGTRTVAGRWRYRARPAAFRDFIARDGEL